MNHHIFPARRNISPIKNANETFFEACLFALQKKKREKKSLPKVRKLQKNPSVCSPSIRDIRQSGLCLPRAAMKDSSYKKKKKMLHCIQTSPVHSPSCVQILVVIMKRLSPGGISCSASKDKSNPNREAYILKRPLFRQLCWAACYTHKISQPLRITRSSQNNHCSTMCWTHYEQGSPRHNRDAAR